MDKQGNTKQVLYKGVMVPAAEIKTGNNRTKLIPANTDRYTVYGIPLPNNVQLTEKIKATAKRITTGGTEGDRQILIKYIRRGKDGYVLGSKDVDEDTLEYFIAKGEPYGVMVAFINEEKVRVGWSKRLENKKEGDMEIRREPLSFTKKDAVKIAVLRGLVDTITFRGSNVFADEKVVIPKAIAKALPSFISKAQKYFKMKAINVFDNQSINTEVIASEKECPPFSD